MKVECITAGKVEIGELVTICGYDNDDPCNGVPIIRRSESNDFSIVGCYLGKNHFESEGPFRISNKGSARIFNLS
jgi:hypothetical protein